MNTNSNLLWQVYAYVVPPSVGFKSPIRYYRQCHRRNWLEYYDEKKRRWYPSANTFDFPQRNSDCRLVAKYVRFKK